MGGFLFALHVLGAVLWVGGMAFAIFVLRPAAGILSVAERLALTGRTHKRFFLIVWHAMPIVILSGYSLMFTWYGGFAGAAWHVHLMHLTGLIMGAVFLGIFFGPWKQMRAALAANDLPKAGAANESIRLAVTFNLVLGLLTVVAAAWGRFGG